MCHKMDSWQRTTAAAAATTARAMPKAAWMQRFSIQPKSRKRKSYCCCCFPTIYEVKKKSSHFMPLHHNIKTYSNRCNQVFLNNVLCVVWHFSVRKIYARCTHFDYPLARSVQSRLSYQIWYYHCSKTYLQPVVPIEFQLFLSYNHWNDRITPIDKFRNSYGQFIIDIDEFSSFLTSPLFV